METFTLKYFIRTFLKSENLSSDFRAFYSGRYRVSVYALE